MPVTLVKIQTLVEMQTLFQRYSKNFYCIKKKWCKTKTLLYSLIKLLYSLFKLMYSLFKLLYNLFQLLYNLFKLLYNLFKLLYSLFKLLYSLFKLLYSLFKLLYSLFKLLICSVLKVIHSFSFWLANRITLSTVLLLCSWCFWQFINKAGHTYLSSFKLKCREVTDSLNKHLWM